VVLFFGLYLGENRYAIHFELLAERIDRARPDRAGRRR
jgi:predicted LPLAT superfamily acyltransferase